MPSPIGSEKRSGDKPDLKNLTLAEMEAFLSRLGKEKYRARQIFKWLYRKGVDRFDDMTDLARSFREEIPALARIGTLDLTDSQTSRDGTKKFLFTLEDGLTVESVLIREKNHWTLCVSTQAGCRMGCRFCLTGRFGLKRNLRPGEIAGQATTLRFRTPEGPDIRNIVMMGMGEPLDNYENVLTAIGILTDDSGPAFSGRRITVSTCGLVPGIAPLSRDATVNLAVSLNAPDDETRTRLMPVNRKYPLKALLAACRAYEMPLRRRITFEYILMEGVNDSVDQAEKLARLLRGIRCKINLIPFNPFPGSEFHRPSENRIDAFRNALIRHQYTAIVRASKGGDILAACGQLSGKVDPAGTVLTPPSRSVRNGENDGKKGKEG